GPSSQASVVLILPPPAARVPDANASNVSGRRAAGNRLSERPRVPGARRPAPICHRQRPAQDSGDVAAAHGLFRAGPSPATFAHRLPTDSQRGGRMEDPTTIPVPGDGARVPAHAARAILLDGRRLAEE